MSYRYQASVGFGSNGGSFKASYGREQPSYNDPYQRHQPTQGPGFQGPGGYNPAPYQQPRDQFVDPYAQPSRGNIGGGYGAPNGGYGKPQLGFQPQPQFQPQQLQPQSFQQGPTGQRNQQPPIQGGMQAGLRGRFEPLPQHTKEEEFKAKMGKDIFRQAFNKTSTSPSYQEIVARLKQSGEIFQDLEFTPNINSLTGGDPRKAAKWSQVVWRRPAEFWGSGFAVFKGGIEPNDIKQGQLGDCYFLSTLSALAEYPKRISRLFPETEANAQGCYMVKMCDMGIWKEIIVDDLFPCKNAKSGPIFTRGNDSELWVLILEKAWAKLYGSYAKIEAGLTREVLHDLTGGPTEYFLTQDDDPEKIWDAILKADQAGFAMTCGSGDLADGADLLTSSGLVGSHAYTLLSAIILHTSSGPRRLVRLRNPWGEAEWKGEWSDESSVWTEELKKKAGWENKNDGTFYMGYEDFCKYFTDIQICRIHDDYEYSAHKFTADPRHAVYIRFTIEKKGHHYITINQKSKRFFKNPENYEYSDVFLIVGRELENGEFEYVQGIQRADREVWTDGEMYPGNYVAYVKIPWHDGQPHDVSLSIYGYSKATFEEIPKESFGENFLEKVYMNKAMNSPALKSYQEEGEPNAFRCAEVTDDGFGYFFFWNKSESTLKSEVYFKIMSGIKLRKPNIGKKFAVTVPAGQKAIVLTKVNPYFEVKQVYSEIPTFERSEAQLRTIAKERGQKKQRKHQKTGEMLDIWCHILQHSDGVYFYYENNTKQYTLDEEVKFKLQGLKIEGDPNASNVKFVIGPGQSKEIKLKKTLNEFSIGFSTAYLIKG